MDTRVRVKMGCRLEELEREGANGGHLTKRLQTSLEMNFGEKVLSNQVKMASESMGS